MAVQESIIEQIVDFIRDNNGSVDARKIRAKFFGEELNDTALAEQKNYMRRMRVKGLIVFPRPDGHEVQLTNYGWTFEGFKKEREKEKLDELQTQSVIDTNKSVRTTNRLTIMLAFVSTLFIAYSTWKQSHDTSTETLKELKQVVQGSLQTIDSIQLSLQGIDSSMKIFVEHSQVKDTFPKSSPQQ